MSDAYSFASKSSLKLKGVEIKKKKKKKDKDRDKEKVEKSIWGQSQSGTSGSNEESVDSDEVFKGKTPVEIAYLKKKREREMDRIKKRANLNHKEKVEKFNTYLNSLTEHYDIQKVSWTK